VPLHFLWSQPGGFDATLVKLSLAIFTLNAKAHGTQLAGIPATDKLALTAVFPVYSIAKLDVVGVTADSLRVGPLKAVAVISAL
jgi:hypothetical protein